MKPCADTDDLGPVIPRADVQQLVEEIFADSGMPDMRSMLPVQEATGLAERGFGKVTNAQPAW